MIYTDLISHPTNDPYSHIAPYRVFSFDIECCAEEGGFPEPTKDAVITIANVITEQVMNDWCVHSRDPMNLCLSLSSQWDHALPFLVLLCMPMMMKRRC